LTQVQSKLNSYTEWGELKEVIVGNCVHLTRQNIDLSFKLFFRDNLKDQLIENSLVLQEKLIAQRSDDLDEMARVLEAQGIRVFRPNPIQDVRPFKTPHFSSHTTPCDNPRDQVLIWGDKILETPPLLRTRFFENDLLKPIFYQYFSKGAQWICAPRPMMKDSSFDQFDQDEQKSEAHNQVEIMFDGAQCLRFGRDILMNISNRNHELGLRWLTQTLEGEATIHPVRITDHHLDSMLMPIRPGLLLINPTKMKSLLHKLPKGLQKWDVLQIPTLDHTQKAADQVYLASANIYTNVLPLSESKVMIFAQDPSELGPFADALLSRGIEPVLIRLRHSRLFGGGAHCVTLDTVRDDSPLSFF
jgi:glycine amidinotransferase